MSEHAFLTLLQMTEAERKCEGKECLEIQDENLAAARVLDHERVAHGACGVGAMGCDVCRMIDAQRIALRERLHTQGVDFPNGLLDN